MRFVFRLYIIFLTLFLTPTPHYSFPLPKETKQDVTQLSDPIITIFPLPIAGLSSGNYEWTSDDDSITIPLIRAGRIFLIEAMVDGEKGYLVFDTGASGVVLNKTYFRNHVIFDNQSSNGITGSVGKVDRVSVDNLEITGLKYKNVVADMTNLGHIENKRGVKVLGLFGFSMIKDFEVVFNPDQNQLMLFRVDKKGERLGTSSDKFNSDFTSSFELKNNIILMNAQINGKSLLFCFDTGAETNVIDSYAPKSVLSSITITRRSTLRGAGSTASEVLFGVLSNFQFGPKKFTDMETIITNLDQLSEAYGRRIDGMLGYSFISKGLICINFVKKEIGISYLQPKV
jgi:predicted aspartyl protease